MKNIKIISLIILTFFLFDCGKKIINPKHKNNVFVFKAKHNYVNNIKKKNIKNNLGTQIDFDSVSIIIRYADFDFLSENFSFVLRKSNIFSTSLYKLIPFYYLEKNKKKYDYNSQLFPFYIKLINHSSNRLYFSPQTNCALVDNKKRQYNPFDYKTLKEYKLNYSFRKKRKSFTAKKVFSPVFKYSGITLLTDMLDKSPLGKVKVLNLSFNDLNKSVKSIYNLKMYKFMYEWNKNLLIKKTYIYPNAINTGFVLFPKPPSKINKIDFYLYNIKQTNGKNVNLKVTFDIE